WNATQAPWPPVRNLPALLEAQALATPARIALRSEGATLDYAQLHARSRRIAHALRARGVGRGDLVGICLHRHPDLVAALGVVLPAGAGSVPRGPAFARERPSYLAEGAGLAVVLSGHALADVLDWPRERHLLLDADADDSARAPDGPLPGLQAARSDVA